MNTRSPGTLVPNGAQGEEPAPQAGPLMAATRRELRAICGDEGLELLEAAYGNAEPLEF